MGSDPLSRSLRDLLRGHVPTVECVEVLLLLHSDAGRSWDAATASACSRIPLDVMLDALAVLESGGLVRRSASGASAFQFAPASAELRRAVDELASVYREQRAAVMSQLSINAIERIRSGTSRAFAGAFVSAKGKKDPDG